MNKNDSTEAAARIWAKMTRHFPGLSADQEELLVTMLALAHNAGKIAGGSETAALMGVKK